MSPESPAAAAPAALLLATVVVVVRGVLFPKETAHLSFSDVARYPLPEAVDAHRVMTHGKVLRGLVEVLGIERERGNRKAGALRSSYALLISGPACIASLGFMMG
jgi:hypothetical protein